MKNDKIVVGITHGDINGIGYEVIIKLLSDNRLFELCTPIIYGSPKIMAYHKKATESENINFNNINHTRDARDGRANIINCVSDDIKVELGQLTTEAGKASFDALNAAVKDLQEGLIDVLVTAPINKESITKAGFEFPGHTEYLESNFEGEALMLMVSDNLKVAVVTGHIPLGDVKSSITAELIENKLRILNQSLITDFNIRKPRIAVMGLNPHAGDNGVIGEEEKELIEPLLNRMREEGMLVFGPFPADGFFGAKREYKYDAVLAMYHDQGLIPFKVLSMEHGVNYTAGLNIIRTSPAHGTAFDLAGKGEASEESLREAVYMALDTFRNRQSYVEANKNPLKKQILPGQFSGPDLSVDQLEDVEKEIED
ncbi:4-hydroxythreonine-4-phosphate dehydrogenase PdxA [Saccharicrinis sp. FJH62]|uniref:4-hydroxythreonine-4-phosphate dehydrogenase PdxA n=1 Tax=Saccharicrinis sp. FJH62 TaxID=3344657 RepID=UPI0035D45E8D